MEMASVYQVGKLFSPSHAQRIVSFRRLPQAQTCSGETESQSSNLLENWYFWRQTRQQVFVLKAKNHSISASNCRTGGEIRGVSTRRLGAADSSNSEHNRQKKWSSFRSLSSIFNVIPLRSEIDHISENFCCRLSPVYCWTGDHSVNSLLWKQLRIAGRSPEVGGSRCVGPLSDDDSANKYVINSHVITISTEVLRVCHSDRMQIPPLWIGSVYIRISCSRWCTEECWPTYLRVRREVVVA